MEKKMSCEICLKITYAIIKHHVSYDPEEIILICSCCHFIIHHPPQQTKDVLDLPVNLQKHIDINRERIEIKQFRKKFPDYQSDLIDSEETNYRISCLDRQIFETLEEMCKPSEKYESQKRACEIIIENARKNHE